MKISNKFGNLLSPNPIIILTRKAKKKIEIPIKMVIMVLHMYYIADCWSF